MTLLNFIYMKNLPIYVYVIYIIIGVVLNVFSYKIAIENLNHPSLPLWIVCLGFLFANTVFVIAFSVVNLHFGLYLLISIGIPYSAIWRSSSL